MNYAHEEAKFQRLANLPSSTQLVVAEPGLEPRSVHLQSLLGPILDIQLLFRGPHALDQLFLRIFPYTQLCLLAKPTLDAL